MPALLSLWLQLTGGDQGCPRWRFALTMLAAYGLYHLLLPPFFHCLSMLAEHNLLADATHPALLMALVGAALAAVSLLLAFLPFSPVALLGLEHELTRGSELLLGNVPAATAQPAPLCPYGLGLLLASLLLLLAGSVAFGAAWRRLRAAGRSPLFLLLGLTYLLGFDDSGSYSAEAAGIYLLGPLWLIILYSQPSRAQAPFALFRQVP